MDLSVKPITSKDIKDHLDLKHNIESLGTYQCVGVPELTLISQHEERRVDYWAIDCWQSKQFTKTAYEIKVFRSDWLSELKKPHKRRQAMFVSNLFYFIAPKGIIKLEELPVACGLIEVEWKNNQSEIDHWHKQMQLPKEERDWNHKYLKADAMPPEYKETLKDHTRIAAIWRDEGLPIWRLVVSLCRKLKKQGESK